MSQDGGSVKRWVLEGTDYVYPRTTNKILEAYLKSKGVADSDIMINYTPFGFADWADRGEGDQGVRLGRQEDGGGVDHQRRRQRPLLQGTGQRRHQGDRHPGIAFSVGEEELAGLDTKPLVGHLAACNYFESVNTPDNKAFIDQWHTFIKNPKRTTNDPMEAHYIGFNMWVKAVEKVGTTDPDKVIAALPGITVPNLTGGTSTMLANPPHHQAVLIGEVRADGQFRRGLQDQGAGPRRGVVAVPGRRQEHRRRTGSVQLRSLQHRHHDVYRQLLDLPSRSGRRRLYGAASAFALAVIYGSQCGVPRVFCRSGSSCW